MTDEIPERRNTLQSPLLRYKDGRLQQLFRVKPDKGVWLYVNEVDASASDEVKLVKAESVGIRQGS